MQIEMKMDDSWFFDWYWKEATPEEKYLVNKNECFEDLFQDTAISQNPCIPDKIILIAETCKTYTFKCNNHTILPMQRAFTEPAARFALYRTAYRYRHT